MDETKETSLQQLENTLRNFNRRYVAQRFDICPLAADKKTAGIILARMMEGEIRARGRNPRNPETEQFWKVAAFLTADRPQWLLFTGTPGTGKTTYLKAVERAARLGHKDDTVQPDIRFVKASSLGYLLKSQPSEWEAVKGCKLLLLDDIGFSGEEETANNYGVKARPVVELLEARYDRQLATAISTNLTLPQLRDTYGERIYSRLAELCTVVTMTGQDFRLCAG